MIGNLIIERREALGMNDREQLREALRDAGLRISNTSIRNWELGLATPKGLHLETLLSVLQVPEAEWGAAFRLAHTSTPT